MQKDVIQIFLDVLGGLLANIWMMIKVDVFLDDHTFHFKISDEFVYLRGVSTLDVRVVLVKFVTSVDFEGQSLLPLRRLIPENMKRIVIIFRQVRTIESRFSNIDRVIFFVAFLVEPEIFFSFAYSGLKHLGARKRLKVVCEIFPFMFVLNPQISLGFIVVP